MSEESPVEESADEVPWIDRELSWLRFNARVLQETADPTVPLLERLAFLSIFSSNLDEFFRVRVASLRSLLRLKKRRVRALGIRPAKLLRQIHTTVVAQQEEFGRLFREVILPALEEEGIILIPDPATVPKILPELETFFTHRIEPILEIRDLPEAAEDDRPFLDDRICYLVVELGNRPDDLVTPGEVDYSIIRVPSPPLPRFVPVELSDGRHGVVFIDDIIRLYAGRLFPGREVGGSWAVKMTRDAELYLDDEFDVELVEAIRRSIRKRSTGTPSRFLYDMHAPFPLVATLRERLGLAEEDLVPGGRYHNLHDLRSFPRFGRDDLAFPTDAPVSHPVLDRADCVFEAIAAGDQLLHFPYHSFKHVVEFLEAAADDPLVQSIHLTVYRVAAESEVLHSMIRAGRAGKRVQVFFEVQARFDEASNLEWARRLEGEGVEVEYSIPGLKVHAKTALVVRREGDSDRHYSYLGTGNFNEVTSRFYTDLGLLTAHPGMGRDVATLFRHLAGEEPNPKFDFLLVAPFTLRAQLAARISAEMTAAMAGHDSGIELKLNALEDEDIIRRLVLASQAGVPVRGVIRGICCLAPGVEGQTETVEFTSIVDRYLEHARVYRFHADGKDELFLASADWMTRNLSRRIEVVFPVLDPAIADQVRHVMQIQLDDNVKARRIDFEGSNAYATESAASESAAQAAHRTWLLGLSAPHSPIEPQHHD